MNTVLIAAFHKFIGIQYPQRHEWTALVNRAGLSPLERALFASPLAYAAGELDQKTNGTQG